MNYNQLKEAMDRKNDEKNALKLKVCGGVRAFANNLLVSIHVLN